MKITTEPRSDQWNAEDFIAGPRDFTVTSVVVGVAEQKYDIGLEGETRVWRPPLTVLRLLVKAWGDDAAAWTGRRVRLYLDPTITFGRDKVGGIRLSHVSHIDGPISAMLTETRGKRKNHTVDPLPDLPPAEVLRAEWKTATPERRAEIQAEVASLTTPATTPADADSDYLAAMGADT